MKNNVIRLTHIFTLLILSWHAQGNAMEKPITKEKMLENGLKVVVREDHRSPVVVSQIWYKVGSAYETRWVTGISHALEHMMFQGTEKLPKDGFSQFISRLGGQNNAFTAEDFTAYYEELDAAHLEVSLEAEADRMQHLTLLPEAFEKEIQVVIEERRLRTEDNPQQMALERFMAMAYPMGPYHHPVVGWRVDLEAMTVADLREWYKKWYVPNNAVLVVVGDVKPETVFQLAQKHFGSISTRATPVIRSQQELVPLGEKRMQVHLPAQLPYLLMGYLVPSLKSAVAQEEALALALLSALLDGGESARFSRVLVREKKVAAQVNTYYDLFKRHASQFIITGTPAPGHTVAELEQHILGQIEQLKATQVSEEELQRVKTQLLAQEIYERDSMSEQAIMLGMLESIGLSWEWADTFIDKINALTPAEIQRVAQKYLLVNHLSVTELVPQSREAAKEAAA